VRSFRFMSMAHQLGWLLALGFGACVDGFTGSNVQFDFGPGTFAEASPGVLPTATQIPSNAHYTLYAIQERAAGDDLFEVARFEIHRIVDLSSPCFIDVGDHVPHPGLHVSQFAAQIAADNGFTVTGGQVELANPPPGASDAQKIDVATAVQRQLDVAALASDRGIKVVTSASVGGYPPVAADCNGPATMIPPPTCTDATSNARRLAICRSTWASDPDLFEGTDRVLTSPLNGTTLGFVDGLNPINVAPVGGAQFYITTALARFDAYAVYWQYDDANRDGKPDFPNPPPQDQPQSGTLVFFGRPEMLTRDVRHVHMTSPLSPSLVADMAIFVDLGGDNTQF
jgi:hypothetical protein